MLKYAKVTKTPWPGTFRWSSAFGVWPRQSIPSDAAWTDGRAEFLGMESQSPDLFQLLKLLSLGIEIY